MAAFAPATLSGDAAAWRGASLCSVTQFTEQGLDLVLRRAEELRLMDRSAARARRAGAVLANVFYEPSTRTSCSFQAAMLRLGGSVICVAESTSSAKKGLPLLNAGDGVGEHPTQAVLDLYTLCRELSPAGAPALPPRACLKGKTVVLVGDLKHGRTVHSLVKML